MYFFYRTVRLYHNYLKVKYVFDKKSPNTSFQYGLVQIQRDWDKIASQNQDGTAPAFPVSFTQNETERIDALDEEHREVDKVIEGISEYIGVSADGWTPNDDY